MPGPDQFVKPGVLCKSLSGIEIPLLIVSSNVYTQNSDISAGNEEKKIKEFQEKDFFALCEEETTKTKKEFLQKIRSEKKPVLFITSRVHPGEVCGSIVMQEFLRFITSYDPVAIELRSKMTFIIIPMLNPDGVIMGNYRGCLSGHDLNRCFDCPDPRLHPSVYAIKKLIANMQSSGRRIFGYIDFHAHSTKKCVFIYGPYYPLHDDRYVRVRILAKLLAERTQMFRYPACKFRTEPDKVNAARFVISREFDVMNSLTLESSFYAYLDEERKTIEFSHSFYEKMGVHFASSVLDYLHLLEEERLHQMTRIYEKERRKRVLIKKRRKKKVKEQEITIQKKQTPKKNIYNSKSPSKKKQSLEENSEGKIIRQEDCYENPDLIKDERKVKSHNIADLFNSIKEDIKREENENGEIDSDSSSSSSDTLSKEEEEKVINNILNAIEGFSDNVSKVGRPKTAKELEQMALKKPQILSELTQKKRSKHGFEIPYSDKYRKTSKNFNSRSKAKSKCIEQYMRKVEGKDSKIVVPIAISKISRANEIDKKVVERQKSMNIVTIHDLITQSALIGNSTPTKKNYTICHPQNSIWVNPGVRLHRFNPQYAVGNKPLHSGFKQVFPYDSLPQPSYKHGQNTFYVNRTKQTLIQGVPSSMHVSMYPSDAIKERDAFSSALLVTSYKRNPFEDPKTYKRKERLMHLSPGKGNNMYCTYLNKADKYVRRKIKKVPANVYPRVNQLKLEAIKKRTQQDLDVENRSIHAKSLYV